MPSVCRARTVGGCAADEQEYSTVPSGRTSAEPTQPGGGGQVGQPAGREVVAVQPGARRMGVPDQQRPGVRGEVGGELAGQVDRELGLGPRGDVPDQQLLAAAALVQEQQPLVAGDRGERERGQAAPRAVGLLGDRAAVRGADDPDRRVPRVAVLGVGDRQQRLVVGERADAGVLGVGVDDPGGARRGRPARSGCRRRWRCRRRPAGGRSPARPGSRPRRPAGPARHPTAGARWPGGRRTARRPSARTRRRRCRRTTTWSPRPAAAWRGACPRAGR